MNQPLLKKLYILAVLYVLDFIAKSTYNAARTVAYRQR